MSICARNGCENTFSSNAHNQKYCGKDCCRMATNARMMEKYYDRRDQRAGKARFCRKCKMTKLSRYNNTSICGGCQVASATEANMAVVNMFSSVNWQA